MKDIPNSLAVFCLATYGEGDPTDNAMEFYEWITNGDVDLTGLNYAVSKDYKIFQYIHYWLRVIVSLFLIFKIFVRVKRKILCLFVL